MTRDGFEPWARQCLADVEAALDAWVPQQAPAGLGVAMRYGVLDPVIAAVLLATAAWGVDNTLSRALAERDPGQVVMAKALLGAERILLGSPKLAKFPLQRLEVLARTFELAEAKEAAEEAKRSALAPESDRKGSSFTCCLLSFLLSSCNVPHRSSRTNTAS